MSVLGFILPHNNSPHNTNFHKTYHFDNFVLVALVNLYMIAPAFIKRMKLCPKLMLELADKFIG